MKKLIILMFALLYSVSIAFAQQDPNDLGLPDSLIISAVQVDSGALFAIVQITAVTDDSVGFYNIPLAWHAPLGRVYGGQGAQYFPPLTSWDMREDSVMLSESYFRLTGICESFSGPHQPLFTGGQRQNIFTLRYIIDPNTPAQIVRIDSTYDSMNGSLQFGLVGGAGELAPAFVPGYITTRGPSGADEAAPPREFVLSQNYPNPFNAQTTIRYTLTKSGPADLVIYNILGGKVATLFEGVQRAGDHSVIWDANKMPSGIYFYRLSTSGREATGKMLLLR